MAKNRNKRFKRKFQAEKGSGEQGRLHQEMPKKKTPTNERPAQNGSKNTRRKKTKNRVGLVDSKSVPNKKHSNQQVNGQEQSKFNKKKKQSNSKAAKIIETKKPMSNANKQSHKKAKINSETRKRSAPTSPNVSAKKSKTKVDKVWEETSQFERDLYESSYEDSDYDDTSTDISSDCSMSSTDDTYEPYDDDCDTDCDYEDYPDFLYEPYYDERDADYVLPEHVPEDLRIHKGTAAKRALCKDDNVKFESDNDEPQVIELPNQYPVKSVQQPEGYNKEAIIKLHEAYYARTSFLIFSESDDSSESDYSSDSTECPDLVPIEQDDDNMSMKAFVYIVEKDSSHVPLLSAKINKKQDDEAQYDAEHSYNAGAECEIFTCPAFDNSDDKVEQVTATENQTAVSSDGEEENESDKISYSPAASNQSLSDSLDTSTILDVTAGELSDNENETGDLVISSSPPEKQKHIQKVANLYCESWDMPWVLVLLKEPLYFYGTVRCQLLQGAVEIYGYQPEPKEEVEIFSPRGCSTLQVSPIRNSTTTAGDLENQFNSLKQQFSASKLAQMLAAYEPLTDALIVLKRNVHRHAMLQIFKQNMSENVFPHIYTVRKETHSNYSNECLIDCVLNTDSGRSPLHIPGTWQQIELHKQSKVLLTGGKAVGKSTLLRYLVNRHLKEFKHLLVIDLDIGQPELFIPETISCFVVNTPLLGPGFFYNEQPAKAIAIGSVNVVLCKEQYLRSIEELMMFCHTQEAYREMPWLINTMGYNKGFGLELIAIITKICCPTTIIQLQSNKVINNFDAVLHPGMLDDVLQNMAFNKPMAALNFSYSLLELNSPVLQESRYKKKWEMGPKDMRYATILSRLSAAMVDGCTPLSDFVPLCIPLEDIKFVNLINPEETKLSALESVNIGLVYLCHWLGDETPLQCIGAGFLRSMDLHGKRVYILPAMPYERMSAVNCIAFGEMEMPTSFILGQNRWEETLPTYVYTSHNADSSRAIKQIFHRSPHFLTGKHKPVVDNY